MALLRKQFYKIILYPYKFIDYYHLWGVQNDLLYLQGESKSSILAKEIMERYNVVQKKVF